VIAATAVKGPHIDWAAISPLVALGGGAVLVLMIGLLRSRFVRHAGIPFLTVATLGTTIGLSVWQWDTNETVVSGALRIDALTLGLTILFCVGAIAATLMAVGSVACEDAGHGEFHSLLLSSVMGMVVLAGANDLIALFIGFELLSIPLYVLCASELRRATSLEAGLKYLIIGSVGSATLVYGLALIYGATGHTGYDDIALAISGKFHKDVLLLTGVALAMVGLAFKASVAPFHQWTPDVYEGAPTPVTAFMAVATKAAAFGVILRLFDIALGPSSDTWAPIFSALAAFTIVIGNVGALGQSSLKRMLAYSSVAQAGYMLAGVVVASERGVAATVFYLMAYLLMNMAAFGVICARERATGRGDDMSAITGLGEESPLLGVALTVSMLALAGVPATVGFFGKVYLIDAATDNGYGWLTVFIVLGSAMSFAYYLRVVTAVWAGSGDTAPRRTPGGQPVMAGGSPELTAGASGPPHRWSFVVAIVFMVAVVFFGVYPQPLFDVATDAGQAISTLI
jgi:NADH-quinone oxidoreductase subunit N